MARPTKYKKIYCKRAKEHLAKGYSIKSLSGLFKVNYSTIQLWMQRADKEFSVSIEEGRSLGEALYIKKGLAMIDGSNKGNAQILMFFMKNLYPKWKENPDGTSQDTPVTINFFSKKPEDGEGA